MTIDDWPEQFVFASARADRFLDAQGVEGLLDVRAGSPDALHVSIVLLSQIIEVDRIVGFKYRRPVPSTKLTEHAHLGRALR